MQPFEIVGGGEPDFGNAEFRRRLIEHAFSTVQVLLWEADLDQSVMNGTLAQLASYAPSEQSALAVASRISDERGRLPILAHIARQWEDDDLKAAVREDVRPLVAKRTRDDGERRQIWELGLLTAINMRDPGIIQAVGNESDRERMEWSYAESTGDLAIIREIGVKFDKRFPYYLQVLARVIIHTDDDIAPYVKVLPMENEDDRHDLDEILLERIKTKKDGRLVEDIADPGIRMRAQFWLATEEGGRHVTDGLYGLYTAFWSNPRKHGTPENYVYILADYMSKIDAEAPLADLRGIAGSEPEAGADPAKHQRAKVEALSVLAGIGDTAAATELIGIMNIDSVPETERWRWHRHLANISIALQDQKWALMIRGNGDEHYRDAALLQIAADLQSAHVLDDVDVLVVEGPEKRDELIRQYCIRTGDIQAAQMILDPVVRRQAMIDVAVRSGLNAIDKGLDEEDIWEAVVRVCDKDSDVLVNKSTIAGLPYPEVQFRLFSQHFLQGDRDVLSDMADAIEQSADADRFQLLADLSVYANSVEYAYKALYSFITHGPDTLAGLEEPERRRVVDYGVALFRNVKRLSAAQSN